MKRLVEVCLVGFIMASSLPPIAAQSADVPMQKGISVKQPVIHNAVAIPGADKENAVVVTVTQDGSVYLGLDRTNIGRLSDEIKNALSNRNPKIVYMKADEHAPYSSIVGIMDSVRAAGIQRLGLLTATDSKKPGTFTTPNGLEMMILSPR